jgi:hypothetical protein
MQPMQEHNEDEPLVQDTSFAPSDEQGEESAPRADEEAPHDDTLSESQAGAAAYDETASKLALDDEETSVAPEEELPSPEEARADTTDEPSEDASPAPHEDEADGPSVADATLVGASPLTDDVPTAAEDEVSEQTAPEGEEHEASAWDVPDVPLADYTMLEAEVVEDVKGAGAHEDDQDIELVVDEIDDTLYFEVQDVAQVLGEDADERLPYAGSQPLVLAGNAARKGQQTLLEALAAFRSVRAASQQRASAQDELGQLENAVHEAHEELDWRLDIERRYPQIISEQSEELKSATDALESATQRSEDLEQQRIRLEQELEELRRTNEENLRPYANLAETSRGRADDTAHNLSNLRRKARAAENVLNEATRNRDARIASANRSVDNALDRMRYARAEYDTLLADGRGDPRALQELEQELISEQAHLDAARADVVVITEEARRSVDEAQQALFDARRLVAQAEHDADAAAQDAAEHQDAYDALLEQSEQAEGQQVDLLRQCTAAHEQALQDMRASKERVQAARELLDEAQEVHNHPEHIEAARQRLAEAQAAFDAQQQAVDSLSGQERELRQSTFKLRVALAAAVAVVLLILVVVLVLALRH